MRFIIASEASTCTSNPSGDKVKPRPSYHLFSKIFSISRIWIWILIYFSPRVFLFVRSFLRVRGLLDCSIRQSVLCDTLFARKIAYFFSLMSSLSKKSIAPWILALTGVGFWHWANITSVVGVVGSITLLQCVKNFFVWVQFYAGAKCGVSLFVQPACVGNRQPLDMTVPSHERA